MVREDWRNIVDKKTFLIVVQLPAKTVVEVIEGFSEGRYNKSTLSRLDAKIFVKLNELQKQYPPPGHTVHIIRREDYAALKIGFSGTDGFKGWEGIIPKLIDVKVDGKLICEIYDQIPENEKTCLKEQAEVLEIKSENNIKTYVVQIWLMRWRMQEHSESEK
ncbi:MAG: hypothetical protein UW30_C0001G0001 [Candidatus Giovannonibacteria bacterium GW2011_GWA2_44_13b]|uniref:Uncharacterized protein n=2 Tax=Candidatus Giovannoniibacteriota TaxID=1752738 RepID=A0A0G1H4D7_9BACT|nr:MAG: hypothetical protein UW30_C0001G0001 [Candidatus Giovannonibacteria bacterium GW2011_GWA2_44_13b]OGF83092.1 MAG: hypothetical protein A2924_03840 [Candidatus Giovannonibacteria bacterium RIFCSPLOWO2_01_FULL_44_16]